MAQSVLLVEDDRSIATVITEALREEGFEVVSCDTIARRDALLGDGVFDVMLTDVMLADGDGLASIDAVRRMAPDMPVIVLSAQNTLDTAVRASDSEAFEYNLPGSKSWDSVSPVGGSFCSIRGPFWNGGSSQCL